MAVFESSLATEKVKRISAQRISAKRTSLYIASACVLGMRDQQCDNGNYGRRQRADQCGLDKGNRFP
jgi:hypothetical protein